LILENKRREGDLRKEKGIAYGAERKKWNLKRRAPTPHNFFGSEKKNPF